MQLVRAVRANRIFSATLGWDKAFSQVAEQLGFRDRSAICSAFATSTGTNAGPHYSDVQSIMHHGSELRGRHLDGPGAG